VKLMISHWGKRSRTIAVSRLDMIQFTPRLVNSAQSFSSAIRSGSSNVFDVYLLNFAVGSFSVSGFENIGR
jgi:hypothetical protein